MDDRHDADDRRERLPGGARPRFRVGRSWWLWFLIPMAAYIAISVLLGGGTSGSAAQISYSEFKAQVTADNVSDITNTAEAITGHTRKAVTSSDGTTTSTSFSTTIPSFPDQSLMPLLEAHKVTVSAATGGDLGSTLLMLLYGFGPILLLGLFFVWMWRRGAGAAGDVSGLGRSRARLYDEQQPGVSFADVAGEDEALTELQEVVDFLREPQKYQKLGGLMPKGVLLVGQPGTGKTLLARAVAGEAHVPFFNVSASEFVEMIVGVGAARVRDLFQKARASAPAIIFIDELDAIGRTRSATMRIGGHDEQEQTLNQILTEMDGFDSRVGVVVLAATNRPDVLDSALLRPGRFDRHVTLEVPDRAGRAAILRIHARNVPLAADVDLDHVAQMTTGLVGADLGNLINEAALMGARRGHAVVEPADLETAYERVLLGAERHIVVSGEDRRRIAYHEAGHAVVGLLLPEGDAVHKVSIIPHGRSLGVTLQRANDDRRNLSEAYLRGKIAGALAGRAAESEVYGTVTTGAEDDLKQVTAIAHEMVVRWGMSPVVGPLQYTEDAEGSAILLRPHTYSDATARLIDVEVKRIVDECFEVATRLLHENRSRLDSLATALLAEEQLDEAAILAATGLSGRTAPAVPAIARPAREANARPLEAPAVPV